MKRTVMLCMGIAIAVLSSIANAASNDGMYARPGRLIDAGHGVRLNVYCLGSGSPTVIFDAGWEDWSPSWVLIQPTIARYTRACTYDRAGSGFSGAGPMPRTSVEIARELHAALHNGHIPGPYLLVGHSFGSYTTRTFSDMYMPEVYGLVIVDGESGDLDSSERSRGALLNFARDIAALKACRAAIAHHGPLPPIPAAGHSYRPAPNVPCSHQFFRGLPMPQWSAHLNATVLHIANTRVALYDAVISEMEQMPADAEYLIQHRRSFGNRPIIVLTAQLHGRGAAFERRWASVQRRYLSLSSNAKQVLALRSGHYIQLDQPRLVIDAIREELHTQQKSGP